MSEVKGIKETVDLVLLVVIAAQLAEREIRGDGFQRSDIVKIILSGEFRQKFTDAITGIVDVPAEIADLSRVELLDLVMLALSALRPTLIIPHQAA